jgi:putative spermidine/putrescine transport system ATP-binding protein
MAVLEVSGLSINGNGDKILHQISFHVEPMGKLAIMGETGSGKSTLLKVIAGLIQEDEGELIFRGEKIKGPAKRLVPGEPGIAYLSQYFQLPKFLRVQQVLEYADVLPEGMFSQIITVCHIEHLLSRRTDELSGGEQQRIALARLLLTSPRILLLDEPYSHLDNKHKQLLKHVIQNLGQALAITCILVSHDPADVLSWADQILVMQHGKIMQYDSPDVIYKNPVNAYVAGLTGTFDLLPSSVYALLSVIPTSNKQFLFVRPEYFHLSDKGIPVIVKEIFYYGSHDVVCVHYVHHEFHIRTLPFACRINDQISVELIYSDQWFLS